MSENIPLRVQFKRMTASEWARSDVILLESEIGFETDTGYAKFGDGKNRFSKLKYLNKPDLDAFAQKKETDNKIAKLESIKADKDTVYLKAESKKELDKKMNLTGGTMTGQLQFKPNSHIKHSSSTGGAINIDMSKSA
ncbi:TPA: hyaluronoglucosaminidase, partial [Streptococcus pyogenes]|nr:hyaluronoglucosaminidase [Streptococcus pyogenes]